MITREEAIKHITTWMYATTDLPPVQVAKAFDMALAALRPVSREQVILCKDCQYWQGNNGGYPHPECRWGNDETPDEDDYCSFAERLEVNKNGSTWEEIRD